MPGPLENIAGPVWRFVDAVNVYVVVHRDGPPTLIDLGSGAVLKAMKKAKMARPGLVLHTDCRGDRTFGHHAHPGLRVGASERDRRFFEQAEDSWAVLDQFHCYDGYERFWIPRKNIPVDVPLYDGMLVPGCPWDVPYLYAQETPGHMPGSMSFLCIDEGKRYLFCGDALQAGGTLHSIYELQRSYNFFEGMHGIRRTLGFIASAGLDGVFPSHGEPMLGEVTVRREAQTALKRLDDFWDRLRLIWPDQPRRKVNNMRPVTSHLRGMNNHVCHALVDDDGHAIMFDTGHNLPDGFPALFRKRGIKVVEYALITHHHDDHVGCMGRLRQEYGTKLVCHQSMTDVLERPESYALNCLHDAPLTVDVELAEGDTFAWRGYRISAHHFPSQTHYHAAYFVEVDGRRVLVGGDAIYWEPDGTTIRPTDPDWRNMFDIDTGYLTCAKVLKELKPDLLLDAHVAPTDILPGEVERFAKTARAFHRSLAALVDRKHPTLGINPFWIRLDPYRLLIEPGTPATATIIVENPLETDARVEIRCRLPEGVKVRPATMRRTVLARSTTKLPVTLTTDAPLPRQAAWTLEVTFDGEMLGEAFEGLLAPCPADR